MLNLYTILKEEMNHVSKYEDEKIMTDMYRASRSYSQHMLAGQQREEKLIEMENANRWMSDDEICLTQIPVIQLDNLKDLIDKNKASCDVFLYNEGFDIDSEQMSLHLLGEFKNVSKQKMLEMIASDSRDGIRLKARDSMDLLKNHISFTMPDEEECGLTGDVHLFLVYGQRNDVVSDTDLKSQLPGRRLVEKDESNKQKRASRQNRLFPGKLNTGSLKKEEEKMERFGTFLKQKGFAPCDVKKLPGRALPQAVKNKGNKERLYSMFSSSDFKTLAKTGYFSSWNWGHLSDFTVRKAN